MRAAGMPPIITLLEPRTTTSAGPQQTQVVPTLAAGTLQTSTFAAPTSNGPPTCGTGPVVIGQTCGSPRRAAGKPISEILQESRELGIELRIRGRFGHPFVALAEIRE